jgi:cell division protein FtsQ
MQPEALRELEMQEEVEGVAVLETLALLHVLPVRDCEALPEREGVAVLETLAVLQRLCANDVDMPVGRMVYTGLLNARGEVFIEGLRDVPAELPVLRGPAGTAREVTRRFLAMRGSLVEQGLGLARLSLDARGAWEVVLDNGVVLRLGRHDVDGRFERFLAAAARMAAERADGIAYIDLRYASGFAVGPRTAGGVASGQAS